MKVTLAPQFLTGFVEILDGELVSNTLPFVLQKANLPADLVRPEYIARLSPESTAETYASIQQALRIYYGRGARGILLRVGRKMWGYMLMHRHSFSARLDAAAIRILIPPTLRRKPALELAVRLLRVPRGSVSVHTLDMDLLVSDRCSPTTLNQKESTPVCHVTLGLMQESLFWATGRDHDVEETACRATGATACEFKLTAQR